MKVLSDILDATDARKVTLLGLLDMSAAFWNQLHAHLHSRDISCGQFTRGLKTFLFSRVYSPEALSRTF
jgi:hypothetical protein